MAHLSKNGSLKKGLHNTLLYWWGEIKALVGRGGKRGKKIWIGREDYEKGAEPPFEAYSSPKRKSRALSLEGKHRRGVKGGWHHL